jgi:Trk K+ transport system NAD-binding subunit
MAVTRAPVSQRRGTAPRRRQRYTWRQLLRASLYGRLPLLLESLVSLALVALVLLLDVIVLVSSHPESGPPYTALSGLVDALKLLTFQSGVDQQNGVGPLLYAANVLFALFFIQTLILSARAFFNRLDPQFRQRGLASACGNHVIVAGLGRLGLRVVTRLVEAGNTVVVVERKWPSEFLQRALEMRVPVVVGDAKDPATLHRAGIQRARAVVAGIDDDLANVEIALAARAIRSDIRVVLRAFNETFDQALDRHFGHGAAFSVSAIAAPTFAAAMITRGVDHVLPVESSLLGVAELTTDQPPKGQPLPTIAEFERLHAVRVVSHADHAGRNLHLDLTRTVRPGETLSFLSTLRNVETLRASALGSTGTATDAVPPLQLRSAAFDTFIVCGHGKVGYRVVRWLRTQQPRPKIVVLHQGHDDTMRSAELDELVRSGAVEEVIGDATSPEALRRAHIDQAYVVASVTSDDLVNVQVGMEARRQRPDIHVVLRVFSDSLAENLPALFGIHTAFSTSNLASATLAAAAELAGVEHAFAVDGRLYAMDASTLAERDTLAGKTVGALRKHYGVVVAGSKRADTLSLLPPDDATLAPRDTIFVVADLRSLTALRNR